MVECFEWRAGQEEPTYSVDPLACRKVLWSSVHISLCDHPVHISLDHLYGRLLRREAQAAIVALRLCQLFQLCACSISGERIRKRMKTCRRRLGSCSRQFEYRGSRLGRIVPALASLVRNRIPVFTHLPHVVSKPQGFQTRESIRFSKPHRPKR